MEWGSVLAVGFVFGISLAAPIGPIGLLCIKRTVGQGFMAGFLSGAGAAAADGMYAALSCMGLGLVSDWATSWEPMLRAAGSIILVFIGGRGMILQSVKPVMEQTQRTHLLRSFASTFALTLSNPMTVLIFLAFSASIGTTAISGSLLLVLGVCGGSLAWWLFLSSLIAGLRRTFSAKHIGFITRCSNMAIILFGLYGIVRTF